MAARRRSAGLVDLALMKREALGLEAFVEEAETVAAQGGRSALGAVDLDVLTASDGTWIKRHDEHSTPHPCDPVESSV